MMEFVTEYALRFAFRSVLIMWSILAELLDIQLYDTPPGCFQFGTLFIYFLAESITIHPRRLKFIKGTSEYNLFQSHQVDESAIQSGDHIYTYAPLFLYSHHGIVVENGMVIHQTGAEDGIFASCASSCAGFWLSKPTPHRSCTHILGCGERHKSGVICSCLNCFREGKLLYRYKYGVGTLEHMSKLRSGTCTLAVSDRTSEVTRRAEFLLFSGFGTYGVCNNNCEDFALYCKTSLWTHGRGGSSQIYSWPGAIYVLSSIPILYSYGLCWCIVAAIVIRVTYRYIIDIGVDDFPVKIPVEKLLERISQFRISCVIDQIGDCMYLLTD